VVSSGSNPSQGRNSAVLANTLKQALNIAVRYLLPLLLLPGLAWGSCYTHPDNGATYCTVASECPTGTIPLLSGGLYSCARFTVSCIPPLIWNNERGCIPSSSACKVTISFSPGDPLGAIPQTSGICTPEEFRRATIAALVKLLD
jgi:hypothetical protein